MSRLRRIWRRWRGGEDGSASVEFVILFPVFMTLFGSAFEAGLLTVRQVMLERATDIAVRSLRIGTGAPDTHEDLKRMVCNIAGVIPDCMEAVHIELEPISTSTWDMNLGQVQCIDRDEDIQPVVNFSPGGANELMIVRVCAVFRPYIPTSGLGLKLPKVNATDYALIAASAFVNEPAS